MTLHLDATGLRTVVAPQMAKTREGYTGYRHDAAELAVRRLRGLWYVQLNPTYLFTWDGNKLSRHHASALKEVKEIETHPASARRTRMSQFLSGSSSTSRAGVARYGLAFAATAECWGELREFLERSADAFRARRPTSCSCFLTSPVARRRPDFEHSSSSRRVPRGR
jgi:hypothetical protein